jgi:hypothetical protein
MYADQINDSYREQCNALGERYCARSDGDERRRIRLNLLKPPLPWSFDRHWRFDPDHSSKDELAPAEISLQAPVGDLKLEIAP